METKFRPRDVVIVDGDRIPKPGDHVLAYLTEKQQTVLRKYGEADGCLFQLLASNELWATVSAKTTEQIVILGIIVEQRINY